MFYFGFISSFYLRFFCICYQQVWHSHNKVKIINWKQLCTIKTFKQWNNAHCWREEREDRSLETLLLVERCALWVGTAPAFCGEARRGAGTFLWLTDEATFITIPMLTELYSETDTMNGDEECLVVGAIVAEK